MTDYSELKQMVKQGSLPPVVSELIFAIKNLQEIVSLDDRIIAERNRLLAAIPQCPVHGQCVPYAIEWVEESMLLIRELKVENETLRKDAERYRWMRAQTEEYAEMYFGFADPAITDQSIDEAMNKGSKDD